MSGRLQRWLLGDEADRRFRQDNFFVLVTGYFYAVCAGATLHGEADGIIPRGHGQVMVWAMAVTWTTFFALVRSGWSRRLRDSSLTLPHALAAMALMAVGYVLAGTYRSSVFPLFTLAPMLVMFRLPPRQILALGACACAILAAAMLWVAGGALPHERSVMLVQYVLAAACIVAMVLVAQSVSTLRQRRADQREILTRTLQQARELAVRDALTGAANRHCMEEALHRLTAGGAGAPLALAMLDVDFFKAVNDTHGHRVGDEVLCGLVREARAALGEADLLARWGGEEFLLMLPGRHAAQALALVDQLRRHLRASALAPSVPGLRVSFSAGISQWQDGESVERTIERADRALYCAKRDGRDRCVQAGIGSGVAVDSLQPA